jgi:hypothetical protein
MKRLAILLCLSLAGIARADDAAPAATTQQSLKIDMSSEQQFNLKMHLPNPQRRRKAAIGLVIASAVFLTLGFAFVGAAKSANDGIFANMTYHPRQEDHRLSFEVADVSFFTLSALTFAPAMVLMWDR